jgi:hypothetical protein
MELHIHVGHGHFPVNDKSERNEAWNDLVEARDKLAEQKDYDRKWRKDMRDATPFERFSTKLLMGGGDYVGRPEERSAKKRIRSAERRFRRAP